MAYCYQIKTIEVCYFHNLNKFDLTKSKLCYQMSCFFSKIDYTVSLIDLTGTHGNMFLFLKFYTNAKNERCNILTHPELCMDTLMGVFLDIGRLFCSVLSNSCLVAIHCLTWHNKSRCWCEYEVMIFIDSAR